MTARLRSLIAVAILLALAAHPLAHPLLKECPCIHEVAAVASGDDAFVLEVKADRALITPVIASQAPALGLTGSRAPPAA